MKYIISLIVLLTFALSAYAWLDTDSPEGHVESATHNADGKIYASTTTTIETLYGTMHKGGADQAGADAVGIFGGLYVCWDRNDDGEINQYDEPVGQTVLSSNMTDSVETIPVTNTTMFFDEGEVIIGTEVIRYVSKTATTLVCEGASDRGYGSSTAATHTSGDAVTAINMWEPWTGTITCDGSPDHAIGWDATYGSDDGTEGDLIQQASQDFDADAGLVAGRSYLVKIRVVDGSGNTNTEVGGVDKFYDYGQDSYVDLNGDAAQGLEDDEVLWIRVYGGARRVFGLDTWYFESLELWLNVRA